MNGRQAFDLAIRALRVWTSEEPSSPEENAYIDEHAADAIQWLTEMRDQLTE